MDWKENVPEDFVVGQGGHTVKLNATLAAVRETREALDVLAALVQPAAEDAEEAPAEEAPKGKGAAKK